MELVFVLAAAAVILGAAITFGSQWVGSARVSTHAMDAAMQRDALLYAARSWYLGRYCQPDRRSGTVETPQRDIGLDVDSLRAYLPGGRLPEEDATSSNSWQIRITRPGGVPPHLHALWRPTPGEFAEGLARRTGALCDDDDDPTTAERCRDAQVGATRLLWSELLAKPRPGVARIRRQLEWQSSHGIGCDTDGPDQDGDGVPDPDGVLDARCDSDGDGRFGPYDANGDGLDDTGHYDADGDGALDLDVAGGPNGTVDLAVDVHDWQALGC